MVELLKNVSIKYYMATLPILLNDIEPEPEYYNYDNDNEQIMYDNNEGGQADHYDDEGQVDHHDEGKADHGY